VPDRFDLEGLVLSARRLGGVDVDALRVEDLALLDQLHAGAVVERDEDRAAAVVAAGPPPLGALTPADLVGRGRAAS
jgi:hypothetical protein